ncbi:FxLYD domain-containing protein [Patescibacteria group bacterium]|nr:FxLYD domain-containing protein [Patescibacteria group bacterium]
MSKGQRLIKQSMILAIFITSLIMLYKILFPPVIEICFNSLLDLGEEKIDCGGICAKKCPPPLMPPDASDISLKFIDYVQDGEGSYDLVARISNSNVSWGLSSLGYRFQIFDENGNLTNSEDRETYIMPSGFIKDETGKYVIYDNFKYEGEISDIKIQLFDYVWNEIKDSRELLDYNVEIIQIKNTYGEFVEEGPEQYYVYGETKNNSRYSFYNVDIAVVVFDENDDVIGAGITEQATMASGDGWEFRIFWLNEFKNEIDHIDYEAQTNIFNGFNFMKEYGTGESYSIPR